ncbi:MAG: hypothetical protein WAV72_24860 [Bradyrhizobium sp.]
MRTAKVDRHAKALRDLAMMIVAAHGPHYRDDHLVIEYRARSGDAPHGLDVWRRDDRTTKVLCMVWSDDADAFVVSYRSGPWERALHRAAAGAYDTVSAIASNA